MEKIKFIADTASDVPDEDLREYNIDMPSVPITIDGEGYFERRSFSIPEFYEVLAKTSEIPATSRVPADDYLGCYNRAFEEGYSDIINITINSTGSGTNASAQMARDLFYREHPEAKDKCGIHIVDSRSYSMGYGYAVITAAKMARDGKPAVEILDFLENWISRVEVYLGCYSLEYAKKSGRISAASAFVGDVLGLRPIITLIDGNTRVVEKVRGDKQLVTRLIDCYRDIGANKEDPVVVVCGSEPQYGEELKVAFEKELGRPVHIYRAGASIVINAGPKMVAFVCLAPNRR